LRVTDSNEACAQQRRAVYLSLLLGKLFVLDWKVGQGCAFGAFI
jgi:hypothetical protein